MKKPVKEFRSFFKVLIAIFLIAFILKPLYSQENSWNLALGMPVSASGYAQGFVPQNMIDANSPLCWTVEGGGFQWFEIDLRGPASNFAMSLPGHRLSIRNTRIHTTHHR